MSARITRAEFAAIKRLAAEKKAKRLEKGLALGLRRAEEGTQEPRQRVRTPKRTPSIKRLSKRGTLKAQIIRLLGLLDMLKNGKSCRMIPECPVKGPHNGTLAYHLVPASRGDNTRFMPENVIWACSSANYGEVMNRSLYREKHVSLFGRERIERLEALAHETRKYSRTELNELRQKIKKELEA